MKTLRQPKLNVNGIFYSIQGEGVTAGTPSIFLRTSNCNLRCIWCDSKYTWDWKKHSPEKEIKGMSFPEVLREIRKYPCQHLVVTGGEPMLQKMEITPLLRILKNAGYFIEMETNGTIPPEKELKTIVDQWNVSPKLSNSRIPKKNRCTTQTFKAFLSLQNSWFKFVISEPKDEAEVLGFIERHRIPKDRVLLMPQAKTKKGFNSKSGFVVELCKKYGFRFSPRLHVQFWGNRRAI